MITVVYCTRQTNPNHTNHLIKTSGLHKNLEVIEIINNGESLTKCYNRGLEQAKNNIVVFCHDDLTIETNQWGQKLLKQFARHSEFGIIGVAGTKFMSSSGCWWDDKKKMYGRVAHTHEGKTWLSTYSADIGQDIEETIIVDGVFFAVDKTKLKTKFNETVEGFHFYDISFCFENFLEGVKIGVVTNIRINHQSIGMTNEDWEKNRLIFADTFKDKLPITLKKVLHKGQKLKVLIGCINFVGDKPEDKYIINLIKQLNKQNCDVYISTNIDKKGISILKQLNVKLYSLQEPPGFKLGDGKWSLNSAEGPIKSQENTLYKLSPIEFDIIHVNQKPVSDHLLRLYPDTNAINTIHGVDKMLDEPTISGQVKKYISVNSDVREVLIDGYGINEELILDVDNSENGDKIIEEYKFLFN